MTAGLSSPVSCGLMGGSVRDEQADVGGVADSFGGQLVCGVPGPRALAEGHAVPAGLTAPPACSFGAAAPRDDEGGRRLMVTAARHQDGAAHD